MSSLKVHTINKRDVVPVRVAVTAERPLGDGRGRNTCAGILRALEAAVAAAGLAGGGARVGAEVAGRARPDTAGGPVVGDVEGDLLASALLPAVWIVSKSSKPILLLRLTQWRGRGRQSQRSGRCRDPARR